MIEVLYERVNWHEQRICMTSTELQSYNVNIACIVVSPSITATKPSYTFRVSHTREWARCRCIRLGFDRWHDKRTRHIAVPFPFFLLELSRLSHYFNDEGETGLNDTHSLLVSLRGRQHNGHTDGSGVRWHAHRLGEFKKAFSGLECPLFHSLFFMSSEDETTSRCRWLRWR